MRSRTVTLSTCVENTAFPYFSFTAPKDHLHIRGEYRQTHQVSNICSGSPPHTWRIHAPIDRLTDNQQDHLHIRGEYKSRWVFIAAILGSPPHTWRILRFNAYFLYFYRITSTYVENTCSILIHFSVFWDHLHIRGEYPKNRCTCINKRGSPPHTWRILDVVFI